MSTTEHEVPESVTFREVRELLRTFQDSGWSGMTVELHGMRITVGKHGPPAADHRSGGAGRAERGSGFPSDDHGVASPAPASASGAAAPAPAPASETASSAAPASAAPASAAPAGAAAAAAPGTGAGAAGAPDLAGCVAVTSPAVGAFWVAPSPGQPPFVQVGDVVAQDQQLAIVEVMKLMNPVVAPVAGTLVHLGAANADLVEFEQPLFWIRPSDG